MKYYIYFLLFLFNSTRFYGQAAIQDASGESKFYPDASKAGWVSLNTSSSSVKLGFIIHDKSSTSDILLKKMNGNFFLGLEVAATPKNGVANIYNKQNLAPGVSANGNFGITGASQDRTDNYMIFLKPSVSYNQYSVINQDGGATATKITKQNKWLPAIELDVNNRKDFTVMDTTFTVMFWAASVGFQKTNNYTQLNDVSLNTIVTTAGNVQVVSSHTAKLGVFREYNIVPVTFDFAIAPTMFSQKSIGFNFYSRNNFTDSIPQSNLGLGIYFANPTKVSDIVGGIGYQLNDIFNYANTSSNSFQRSTIFFYIGYSIGKK